MATDNIKIGTAGFGYNDWLGNFYPQFCPQADFLRYYSLKFSTVELDNTFYRIPTGKSVNNWRGTTPDNFAFSAKFPRKVTHEGSLNSRINEAERFISSMHGLHEKLGPLLLQFPYSFKPQVTDSCLVLKGLIDAMPADLRIAVEFRNKCWLCDELYSWLRKRGIALCLVDHPWVPRLKLKTADFSYIRLLGDRKAIGEDFSYVRFDRDEELDYWSSAIRELSSSGGEVFAYLNNHYSGHAPSTARRLQTILKRNIQ